MVDLGEQLGVLLVQLLPQCIEHGGLVDALALTSGAWRLKQRLARSKTAVRERSGSITRD